jgi:hypothetical protein
LARLRSSWDTHFCLFVLSKLNGRNSNTTRCRMDQDGLLTLDWSCLSVNSNEENSPVPFAGLQCRTGNKSKPGRLMGSLPHPTAESVFLSLESVDLRRTHLKRHRNWDNVSASNWNLKAVCVAAIAQEADTISDLEVRNIWSQSLDDTCGFVAYGVLVLWHNAH